MTCEALENQNEPSEGRHVHAGGGAAASPELVEQRLLDELGLLRAEVAALAAARDADGERTPAS